METLESRVELSAAGAGGVGVRFLQKENGERMHCFSFRDFRFYLYILF